MPPQRAGTEHNRSGEQSVNGGTTGGRIVADGSCGQTVDEFDMLFRRHRGALGSFALRLARNRQIAADVCQQTWLKFFEAARSGRCRTSDDAATHAYLMKVARNVYIDEYVRSHNVSRVDCTDSFELERAGNAGADHDTVERTVEKAQLGELLRNALVTLPPLQKQVLRLWAAGVTPTAVAETERTSRDTILSRKKYGFAKLRNALLARGLTADIATVG